MIDVRSLPERTWFRVLIIGVIIFFALENAMLYTQNIFLAPAVIMVGSFLVPLVFVVYVYESIEESISFNIISAALLVGGSLGVSIASFLEYNALITLEYLPLLLIGFVEEGVKLLFPLYVYFRGDFNWESDGVFLGVASGMGFAALETMSYSLLTLVETSGNVVALLSTLLVRGLATPAGHGAWTGFVCAVIWKGRGRARGRALRYAKVLAAFAAVVLLHTLWNTLQSARIYSYVGLCRIELATLAIALFSFGLLLYSMRDTKRSSGKVTPHMHRPLI